MNWIRECAAVTIIAGMLLPVGCSTVPRPGDRDEQIIRLGTVEIHPSTRTLVTTGYVNQVVGLIELFACGPKGKTHESVFVLFANPLDIQTGLLLLGLKHGEPMASLGMGPPEGDTVDLTVEWEEAGEKRRIPAEDLVQVRETGSLLDGDWVFNGSVIIGGQFKALAEESLIATYWDPWAIINTGSPYGADDEALRVNTNTVPPLHTNIRLLIQAR